MAKHNTTTVQALHKERSFIPDCCPCGELLETSLGWHQCLRGRAAAIVHPVPRGPWAAATQPNFCLFHCTPSIMPEGWAVMSLWTSLECHSHWDSFHVASRVLLQDGRGWEPAPQLLVASDATFIIKAGPLAACVGISVRSSAWTSSFKAFQLHPITFTSRVCPSCVTASLKQSRVAADFLGTAIKTHEGMRTPSPVSKQDGAKGLSRVVDCHMVLGMRRERERLGSPAQRHILTAHVASTTNTSKCFPQTDGTA